MATRTTKGSGQGSGDDDTRGPVTDEEYDSTYEDDLLELVERLARRRPRPRRGPAPAKDDDAADADLDADTETDVDTDIDADADEDQNAGRRPAAARTAATRTSATDADPEDTDPDRKTGAKTEAKTEAEPAPRVKAKTVSKAVAPAGAKSRTKSRPDAARDTDDTDDTGAAQDTESEDAAAEPVPGDPAARRLRVLTVLSVVLATALAVVTTFAVMQWRDYGSDSSPQAVRKKVAERAGVIVSTLFTYDYHDARGYLEKQAAVMTKSAAAAVKPNWSTLTTLFETGKYVSTAQIEQVYVGDISGDKASVIVVVNNKLVTSRGIQNSAGATLQFTLAKENGVWLASAVPKLESTGVQTNTDLQGKPLQAATPTPSPSK